MVLNKISLENFLGQELLYSKNIRGQLEFKAETHMLDGGKELQIFLFRDLPLEQLDETKIKTSTTKLNIKQGVLRLMLNDQKFMINCGGEVEIGICENNYEGKKLSISIFINSSLESDNSKLKKEIKDYFMEE